MPRLSKFVHLSIFVRVLIWFYLLNALPGSESARGTNQSQSNTLTHDEWAFSLRRRFTFYMWGRLILPE